MAIRGFMLDPESHDLAFDAGGRLRYVEDDAATAQEIKTRILFFRGENFMDTREGVPYYTEILEKGVDLARVREIFRKVIASVPSVVDVPLLSLDLDRTTRTLTVVWEVRTATGRLIRSEDFPPLVV